MARRKKKFSSNDTKVVSRIKEPVEVNDKKSELVVKTDFNLSDGTFKISAFLVTKQVDSNNPDKTAAIIQNLTGMIEKAVEEALLKRQEVLESLPLVDDSDEAQGSLPLSN